MQSTYSRPVIEVDRHLLIEDSLTVRQAQSIGHTMRVRVDWSGDAGHGTFEVLNPENRWEPCGDLEPDAINDVILAGPRLVSDPFVVRIERGPEHANCPFEAWARKIAWRPGALSSEEALRSDFSAIRATHYDYAEGMHTAMSTLEGNVQIINLALDAGCDWELWINLRHPAQDIWRLQDPIVRPIGGNGSPTSL
jgi:hypothetical protein